ncbi:MAG: tellurite resistance/C4-dicarboxylate transporter family protein [Chloroflexi bacterium]|nr:tellurite resistance/C4-dicarboxylate transporter family protein [Chloroflexota bacterium]
MRDKVARENHKNNISAGIRDLFPGYFALVMATGIISIASYLLGIAWLAWVLFFINIAAYVVLWVLTIVRLVCYPKNLLGDVTGHVRGPGFFTIVAGTSILGNQFVLIVKELPISIALWFLGMSLWFVLIYTFFLAVSVRDTKPSIDTGLHGGWLVTVVATQSIAVLGTLVASRLGFWQEFLLFFTLVLYLVGCMLYVILISLICYRLFFFKLTPESLSPPYWVNMGAVAITTLAGARLILAAPQWSFLQDILPFLKGFTLFFWSTASWWFILLILLGFWLHVYKHFPLRYSPQYWSLVFPLGMYTTSTFVFSQATGLSFMVVISRYMLYVALFAWVLASFGLVRRIVLTLRGRKA